MIINSKFVDYYDSLANSVGRDPKVVYNRTFKVVDYNELKTREEKIVREVSSNLNLRSVYYAKPAHSDYRLLLFCGEAKFFMIKNYTRYWFSDIEEYKNYRIDEKTGHLMTKYNKWYLDLFGKMNISQSQIDSIHKEFDSPVISLTGEVIHINPMLKKMKFPYPAYEAYQKIFQFLSAKDPETVEVGNDIKISSHGYDKGSFRREKGGPTRKRKLIERKLQ